MQKVIVADDSIVSRKNVKNILNNLGYNVIAEADNGLEAFILFERFQPDLVIMDFNMPIMNGLDSLKCILNKFPQANIIIMSSIDNKEIIEESLEKGAKYYIIKPVNHLKLFSVIHILEQTIIQSSSLLQRSACLSDFNSYFENRNGILNLRIPGKADIDFYNKLREVVFNFRFISPLAIQLNYDSILDCNEENYELLKDMVKFIESLKAECKIVPKILLRRTVYKCGREIQLLRLDWQTPGLCYKPVWLKNKLVDSSGNEFTPFNSKISGNFTPIPFDNIFFSEFWIKTYVNINELHWEIKYNDKLDFRYKISPKSYQNETILC